MWKLGTDIEYDFNKLKEEKIKKALAKGYSETPENYSFEFLCKRLREELWELEWELGIADNGMGCKSGHFPARFKEAKKECADVANIVDFIFKKLSNSLHSKEKTETE